MDINAIEKEIDRREKEEVIELQALLAEVRSMENELQQHHIRLTGVRFYGHKTKGKSA